MPPSGGRRLRTTGLNAVAAISKSDVWAVGGALGAIAPAGTTDVWAWGSSPNGTLVERFTP